MVIYVGSLKFSPVYKSHCCAFGKACEEQGYSVKYIFSHEYEWMLPAEIREKTIFIGKSVDIISMLRDALDPQNKKKIREIFSKDHPSAIYIQNYHFLNNYIAKLSKKNSCKFIYHVHEPYVKNKKAHGGFHQYWLYLFEYFHGRLLKNTDVAVVSSKEASSLFDLRYPHFSGRKMLIPLLYEDLGDSKIDSDSRTYVTFVGPPVPAKNPEKFMEIVKYCSDNNVDLKFLLFSRSKVSEEYYGYKNLDIFIGDRVSDEKFGEFIKKSFVVLTPYKRETQSSVILVSYMYGTPVVSSNVGGLPEFVNHKKTGYLLNVDSKVEDWVDGIKYVKSNFLDLSKNCRDFFVENCSGENWADYLQILTDQSLSKNLDNKQINCSQL